MSKRHFFPLLLLLIVLATRAQSTADHQRQLDSLQELLPILSEEEATETLSQIVLLQYALGQTDSCMASLDKLIDINQKTGDLHGESKARWNKLAILNNARRNEQLLDEAEEQRKWYKDHEEWDRYYLAWNRKASALRNLCKMHTALREAKQMLEDAQQRDNVVGRALAMSTMAYCYMDIHQYEQAEDALKRALEMLRHTDDSQGTASGIYDHYCQVLSMQKEHQEVLRVADQWLDYLGKLAKQSDVGDISGPFCSAYLAKAGALTDLQRYKEAAHNVDMARTYYQQNPNSLARYYILLQQAHLAKAQGQYAKALLYTDTITLLEVADSTQYGHLRADLLAKQGRHSEAAGIYRSLLLRKDTTFSREMRAQLDELNTLFHVDELQMKNSLERSRWHLIVISLIAIALMLILFLHLRSSRQLRAKNEQLRIANAKAEESSKMKTQFIKNISHEIRTPLNILSGFAQVIASPDMQLTEENMAEIRNDVLQNTNRITSLVNKMLELSEASSQTVIDRDDEVSVNEIATQAVDRSRIRLAEHVTFSQDTPEDLPLLRTNLTYASRALSFLLGNAHKFIGKDNIDGTVTLRVRPEGDKMVFTVEDNGIGVPPEEAEHIFEEFVQLDDYYDGTGIGLTVARSMARRLGGDVTLDTHYSPGARFVYTLPLA